MRIIISILLFSLWIYALSIFKRKQMNAFYFVTGSAGFFLVNFILFKKRIALLATKMLEFLLDKINLDFYQVYPDFHQIFLKDIDFTLFINYECSGMIEILVFISVMLFFPKMKPVKRSICIIVGTIYTILANLVRLLVVIGAMNIYGADYYYIAHSVLGRIVFYALTILLYFYIITWQQLKTQKTGRFEYNKEKK